MGRSTCGTCMLVTATILGPIVMILLAVSFATDHWLEFDVDKKDLSQAVLAARNSDFLLARYTHTRHRGLFRECYPGNDTIFLETRKSTDEEPVDDYCFYVRYEIPEESSQGDWSDDFLSRIHLMRCWLAFFIVALVIFLVAYIFGLVLCCWRQSKWAYIAGLCAYVAAFSTAASIAFFHGAEYLERNKISQVDPYMGKFYLSWDAATQRATDRTYGYSYIIGWIAMVLAAFTATSYSVAGCYIGGERYREKEYLDKGRSRDYLERSYPMTLEPAPKDYYYGYHQNYGYQGPNLYDMETRQPLPAITYGPPEMAQGGWRWQ
ncbi:uncharacterized protein LOC132740577 isoform X2 [Ruditapes philippinarum]|uniref:uncharacterized protein LOC132740577 isoform X2 n=1 Tax=Ruditapes philippinarum TaxID=129788 RepID=UPI00295BCB61|nr:uncharacterized protein LOC132740577 isoform X2 [Ruditapes philippinarum]